MRFVKDFALPPEKVFAYFAEHHNIGTIVKAEITVLKKGDDGDPNGLGSIRLLNPAGPVPAFEETVTELVPNETIEYKVTKGTPLNHHVGRLTFEPTAAGTHMEWKIEIGTALPGLDWVIAKVLVRQIGSGLDKLVIPG